MKKLLTAFVLGIALFGGVAFSNGLTSTPRGSGTDWGTSGSCVPGAGETAYFCNINVPGTATISTPVLGGTSITVADTANEVVLTLNQDDTTNNPNGLDILNAGTGDSINVDTGEFIVDYLGNTTALSFTDGTATITAGSLTNIKLGTLTNNGFVKTSGGDGTLSIDTASYVPDFNYVQTIFLGKQGNDANDGLSPDKAVLTPTEAITKATALSPADGNRIAISCTDAGEYTDAVIIIPSYIGFNCPNATFSPVGANNVFQIAEESTLIAHKIIQDGGGPAAVVGANTVGKKYIHADTIQATGSGIAIINFAVSTTGLLYVDVQNITVESGVGVSDNSAGGETHLDIDDIYITGNGGTAIFNGGSGNIFGIIHEIEEIGSPTTTMGLDVNAGKVRLSVGEIETDTAYDVESGAELHLSALDLSGTELNDGTLNYYMDGDISGNAGTATSLAGGSGGTVPYQSSAGVTAMLANGTAGKYLQANGTTVAPSWETIAVGSGDLKADGSIPLTANWDVGAFTLTGTQFISDIAIGTAPFVVTSTTKVDNLHVARATLSDTVTTITGLAPDTATTAAAQANITSLGTLTTLTVDDVTINGNAISSGAASSLTMTALAGQAVSIEGISLDGGVMTGASSITSTTFVGALTGAASGNLVDVVDDTTPDLGGELDAGAHSIGFTLQTATGDGTTTIDWGVGNKFDFTFGAQADTFTFTAPANPGNFMLMLKQDGTGGRTATFPATVMWSGGVAPTLTTDADALDACSFYWNGTNYIGQCALDFSVPA